MSVLETVREAIERTRQRLLDAKLRAYFARQGGLPAHRVPIRWLKRPIPGAGEKVCLFVAFPQGGRLLPHTVDHVRAWRDAGYAVILMIVVDSLDDPVDLAGLPDVSGIAKRLNKGYDFAAWGAGIRQLGRATRRLAVVAIANDSLLGPSASFAAMLDRVEDSRADVIGLTASRETRPHFQSYVVFFKSGALTAPAFRRFWYGIRSGDRYYVIEHYETRLMETMRAAGLRCETLFDDGEDDLNPTLVRWRGLIGAGFPYLKVRLLRENPLASPLDGWREAAERAGFDMAGLDRQITALKEQGGDRWQV